jgi:two-component system, NtrC family, response regulator HydG
MSKKLLIVEDVFVEANNLRIMLKKAGFQVCALADSFEEAMEIISREKPDLVLLDIFLKGDRTGIDLARALKQQSIAFIFLSANMDKQILETAKMTRPYGFLVKPFRARDVLVMVDVALYLHKENQASSGVVAGVSRPGKRESGTPMLFDGIVGESAALKTVLGEVERVAPSDMSVLVLGESGTGKELIARAIHQLSSRKNSPYVVVNCASLPAGLIESELFGHEKGSFTSALEKRIGKFEQADGGTIFLDEVGELPLDVQVKFLRVLQEREIERIGGKKMAINVRIIAATNRDLEDEVAHGRFRMDLYYRLNVFPIFLPALRDRKEDILPLAYHFLRHYAAREKKAITDLAASCVTAMQAYSWPGNIRELENVMARSVLLADGPIIQSAKLGKDASTPAKTGRKNAVQSLEENERAHILAALESCAWKLYGAGGAAELLQINASTLNSRMKKLGITRQYTIRPNSQKPQS